MKNRGKFALATLFFALTFTVAPRTAAAKGVDHPSIPIIHYPDKPSTGMSASALRMVFGNVVRLIF